MVSQNSEFTRKLRAAVRAKIEEYGIDVDDELPDYVMIMVGNKKDKARMKMDLKLFLGDNTSPFVDWLFGFFQKVKANSNGSSVPLPQTTPIITTTVSEPKQQQMTKDENGTTTSNNIPSEKRAESSRNHKSHQKDEVLELRKAKSDSRRAKSASQKRTGKQVQNELIPVLKKEEKRRPSKEGRREKKHSSPSRPTKTTTITATTFAVPRPVLRSVVVNPQYAKPNLLHPRIRPRTPSPSDDDRNFSDDEEQQIGDRSPPQQQPLLNQLDLAAQQEREEEEKQQQQEKIAATVVEKVAPKRRVLASTSLLFQRAINQSSQATRVPEAKVQPRQRQQHQELAESKEEDEEEKQEAGEEDDQEEEEKKNAKAEKMEKLPLKKISQDEEKRKRKSKYERQTTTGGAAPTIFQRAILETKRQLGGDAAGEQQLTPRKRRSSETVNEQITPSKDDILTHDEEPDNKKIRIEWEKEDKSVVGESKEGNEEGEEEEDESVLFVNFDRPAHRSIRKERKELAPKSGLTLLKEFICTKGEGKTAEQQKVKEGSREEEKRIDTAEKPQVEASDSGQGSRIVQLIGTVNKNFIPDKAVAPPSKQLHWDGNIEIDDEMSSTDDEAEIDALLEEQHSLKKIALQREREEKGRELPPTSALTRPLLYQPELQVSLGGVNEQTLLSPSDANLLPATFHQQSNIISNISSSNAVQQPIVCRPFATVAPCATTTTLPSAPATMIVQTHQKTIARQFSHPYSIVGQKASPFQATGYNRSYMNRGPLSKVYAATTTKTAIFSAGHVTMESVHQAKVIMKLREQHRILSHNYFTQLEEQRLMLAQVQKMKAPHNEQQNVDVKMLMFRCKQLEKNAQQIKLQLETLNEQILNISKGNQQQATKIIS